MDDVTYAQLQRKILELLSIDLVAYKAPQMRRRLEGFVRKQVGDNGDPLQFVRTLGQQQEVLAELRDMLTINVSEFFRDASQWQLLRSQILPGLLEQHGQVKIWSAGCSAGQEPYSLAILADELGAANRVRIMATDLDRGILARAREGGPYPENELKQLTPAQRSTYLEERDGKHFVGDSLRRQPRFSELNLLRDTFQKGFHLICCRHVMIYFDQDVKMQLVGRFRDALAPGGLLFIGGTEALLGGERVGLELAGGNFYRRLEGAQTAAA